LTVGPWRPVSLHSYYTRISDLYISAQVDESLETDLTVRITHSPSGTSGFAEILLKDPAGQVVTSQTNIPVNSGFARAAFQFKKGDIQLWYPVGYGEQALYDVEVKVMNDVRHSLEGSVIAAFAQSMVLARSGT
jgi:beta-mannosidase